MAVHAFLINQVIGIIIEIVICRKNLLKKCLVDNKIYYCHFYIRCMHLKMRQFLHFQMQSSDVKMTFCSFKNKTVFPSDNYFKCYTNNSIYQKWSEGRSRGLFGLDYGIQNYSAQKVDYWVVEFWRNLLNCSFN